MNKWPFFVLVFFLNPLKAQNLLTPFEKSDGKQTATYFECIDFYKALDKLSPKIAVKEIGQSDAGFPYHVVLYSNDGIDNPAHWRRQQKLILLIINDIHPGEPDGVDASMMYLRDISTGRLTFPDNVALAVIPIYNIGGALNRNSNSRVNQDGPESYGFRGNAQNLDLNRDFTKSDSRDARSFATIFQWINPDIQLDTHVSDGADYQHTMTLVSTQWNKLGGELGRFAHDSLDPGVYRSMAEKKWPMCPYVNAEQGNLENGWAAFYDQPRYSSGYAALFHTISYMSETHMLKPFRDRVHATYALIESLVSKASAYALQIKNLRAKDVQTDMQQSRFPISWKVDSLHFDSVLFSGYQAAHKKSEVTGLDRLFYDHQKPYTREIKFYDYYAPDRWVLAPRAYLVPQGWHEVIDLLRLNGIQMEQLPRDTIIAVDVYKITDYASLSRPYEKHHKNFGVHVSDSIQSIRFLKGDYYIDSNQPAKRFLIEMLEPQADDSYFAWNFFDAILQQKEGYSDYRWEDVASDYLKEHPQIAQQLTDKKNADPAFAASATQQLEFIYRLSPYYETAHLRYPVFRLL